MVFRILIFALSLIAFVCLCIILQRDLAFARRKIDKNDKESVLETSAIKSNSNNKKRNKNNVIKTQYAYGKKKK